MMDVAFAVAFNLLEYWIFVLLMQYICAANMKLNRKNSAVGTGIAALVVAAVSVLLGSDWAGGAVYPALFLTIFLYAGKRGKAFLRLIPAFLLYATLTIFPGAMLDVLFSTRESEIASAVMYIGLDLAVCALLMVLRHIVKKHRLTVCFGTKETFGSIFLFFFTFIDGQLLELMNRQNHKPAVHYGYAALFFAVYFVSVGFYLYMIVDKWKRVCRQTEVRTEMEYMQLKLSSLDDIKESGEQTRRMRHDLNKHLAVMRMLCDEGKFDEVSEYAKQLSDESIQSGVRLLTGNEIVDLIAGQKKKRCEENGIDFVFDGMIGDLGEMTAPDLCGLFANAYDNAIEACTAQNGAYIRTKVHKTRNYTVVEIVNSVDKKVSLKNKAPRKKDSAHGYGMEIMKQIARKYNGDCTFSCDEKEFKVKIVL